MEFSIETVMATRKLLIGEIKRQLENDATIDAREMEQSLREVLQEIGSQTLSSAWEIQDEIMHEKGVVCQHEDEHDGMQIKW